MCFYLYLYLYLQDVCEDVPEEGCETVMEKSCRTVQEEVCDDPDSPEGNRFALLSHCVWPFTPLPGTPLPGQTDSQLPGED